MVAGRSAHQHCTSHWGSSTASSPCSRESAINWTLVLHYIPRLPQGQLLWSHSEATQKLCKKSTKSQTRLRKRRVV